jgi:hypothetical protein
VVAAFDFWLDLLIGVVIAPWIYYALKWRKNAAQFLYNTDEEIREEWELHYIAKKRSEKYEDDE